MKLLRHKAAKALSFLCVFALSITILLPATLIARDKTNVVNFDNDQSADIAVYSNGPTSPSNTYSPSHFFYLTSSSNFTQQGSLQWGRTSDLPIPGDYSDGDGKTDAAIFRWFDPYEPPFDFNQIWVCSGSIPGCPYFIRGFGNVYGRKMARNFVKEGDGSGSQFAEIGEFQRVNIATPPGTPSYAYTFYHENGAGLMAQPTGYNTRNVQVPVPEDYVNNDGGESEIAVFETRTNGTGCYLVWPVTNGSMSPEQCFTGDDFIPVPGYYNIDNQADYGVVKKDSNGLTWLIRYSDTLTDATPVLYGGQNDFPVPADYDGDGKTDLAFVKVVSGMLEWHIRKCIGQTCHSEIRTFRPSTDTPLAQPYFFIAGY